MYLSPQQAQQRFGYHPKTLADWADAGQIEYIRFPGGHRRYLPTSLEGVSEPDDLRSVVLYARVSTHTQRTDLAIQADHIKQRRAGEIIKEIGSGMNFKRRKFLKLMQRVADHEVKEIAIGHKDRLCRFGFDFVEWFCNLHDCQITVLGDTGLSPYQELMQDFMSIMHCFSSRLYFLRRYKDEIKTEPVTETQNPPDTIEKTKWIGVEL